MPRMGKELRQYPWDDASKYFIPVMVDNLFTCKKNPILKGSEKNIFLNLDTQELSQVPEASTW